MLARRPVLSAHFGEKLIVLGLHFRQTPRESNYGPEIIVIVRRAECRHPCHSNSVLYNPEKALNPNRPVVLLSCAVLGAGGLSPLLISVGLSPGAPWQTAHIASYCRSTLPHEFGSAQIGRIYVFAMMDNRSVAHCGRIAIARPKNAAV